MKHLKILTVGLGIWFLCFGVLPVLAHANLSHSEPQANSSLNVSPSEIRIWFTEPVERNYSQIVLRNVDGAIVDLMDSRVDDGDPQQLYVPLSPLPNGLYTVSWRVVSATDGHPTNGSFAFGVGVAVTIPTPAIVIDETVPLHGVLVRWLNLVSFSLIIGVLGFILFVWQPITPEAQPQITHFFREITARGVAI
jgi:copper transport protein